MFNSQKSTRTQRARPRTAATGAYDSRLVGDSMKTAVRRVLLLSALMSPGALYALGLGEIKLNSALNQPFDAEIELVSATQEDLGRAARQRWPPTTPSRVTASTGPRSCPISRSA